MGELNFGIYFKPKIKILMGTTKFKTNIKCDGCIAKVTPFLNKSVGEGAWDVDLSHPDKILTVNDTEEKNVISAIKESGYQAQKI